MVDLLPEQTCCWQATEEIARNHFLKAGFHEIRTPLIEVTDLFARGIGEATDVVGKEMYSFLDKGDRSCTLRPEGTASVVRAVLQNGLLNKGPQRLWYGGPMFRYERPQAGRQRQFHQIGVEYIGAGNARSDAEVISLAWRLLYELGLDNLVLELNTLGSSEDREVYKSKLVSWLEAHVEEIDEESRNRVNTNPLRILDTKNTQTQAILKKAPSLMDSISDESRQRFVEVQELLEALEIPFKLNPRLVRGLDYYNHTAFEITSSQLGAQGTVCGGGRYDGLIEQLGGPPTPSIGWAIGMERLMLLLGMYAEINPKGNAGRLKKSVSPDLYLINRGLKADKFALLLAHKLRAEGLIVELDNSGASFGKQFKRADRSGSFWALIIGDEEVAQNKVKLKSMKTSSPQQDQNNSEHLYDLTDIRGLINQINHKDSTNL